MTQYVFVVKDKSNNQPLEDAVIIVRVMNPVPFVLGGKTNINGVCVIDFPFIATNFVVGKTGYASVAGVPVVELDNNIFLTPNNWSPDIPDIPNNVLIGVGVLLLVCVGIFILSR